MKRNQSFQKFVYKIHSTRLAKSRWNLTLSIPEAIRNHEIIPIADSTLLRFIDELNGISSYEEKVKELRERINEVRKSSARNKKSTLRDLYIQINTLQFKPDYMCLVIDHEKHYDRAVQKGFRINGITYSRLLATNGGVKEQVIVFVSERLKPELQKRMTCGRDTTIPMVPAKYGAYEALDCSSTLIVSHPGIIVVKDCITSFYEDIIQLDDSTSDEPQMKYIKNYNIEKNASDGFGLVLPGRAKQWGEELSLDYIPSGFCTRPYHWSKGMLVTFDFHAFADDIAHNSMITDAWGTQRKIKDADVILTTSMVKLWDHYKSWEDFDTNCKENRYTFGITKVCPKELESERTLNYQFIQSYSLTDEQIDQLITPTVNEIKDVLGDNYAKSILFLRGTQITEENAHLTDFDYIKALQIEPTMANDPYVRSRIHRMIEKKITDAKTGAVKVHGNYQIACGDPYALCQSMFQMNVTGLLNKGEFYSEYWSEKGIDTVTAFRAPMTCHNNIRRLYLPSTDVQAYWYRYIKTMLIFNSFDTAADAMNGEDFDGDMNFLTDNTVLMENHRILPTILCMQRKAEKKLITEELLIQSNKDSFGDTIGIYTNGITSQFDIQAQFPVNSPEYKELSYRILCGQLFQQNAIDKAKGIIAKPRPKYWFHYSGLNMEDKEFHRSLIADKKPYFMIYIYPQLMKQYKKYVSDADKKCQVEFGLTVTQLEAKSNKTPQESDFLRFYEQRTPVGNHPCVMNRICKKIEYAFDGYMGNYAKNTPFDYSILKSGSVDETTPHYKSSLKAVTALYKKYCAGVAEFQQQAKKRKLNAEETNEQKSILVTLFKQECDILCPNPYLLANIVLDICYSSSSSKQFAWDISGTIFIENLLHKNGGVLTYPTLSEDGEITFAGKKFALKEKKLEEYT